MTDGPDSPPDARDAAAPASPAAAPAAGQPSAGPAAETSARSAGPDLPGGLAVVIPAKDEGARIAATVAAAHRIPGVRAVVVVDDGSRDDTAEQAETGGAVVVRHPRNRGKAAAMTTGADRVARLEQAAARARADAATGRAPSAGPDAAAGTGPWALLFVDADLEDSALNTAVLTEPVLAGEADATIAVLPKQRTAGGGRGFVVNLSRRGIESATGWTPTQPLSGMRCLSRPAFEAARPLARGWGVETGMTIDLLLQGFRVREVPCELHHRVTGRSWRDQLHRARQYRDVALALLVRRVRARRRP